MMIRLYLDADAMDDDLVDALRLRGVDVTTALEARIEDNSDEDQLAHAAAQERVLYSFNRGDFVRIHTEYILNGKHHAGIILARQQRHSIGEQMRRLLKIIHTVPAEEMRDRIEFLSAWG